MLTEEQYKSRYPKKSYQSYVTRKENDENPAAPVDDVGNSVPTELIPYSDVPSLDIHPTHLVSPETPLQPTVDPEDRNHRLAIRQVGNNGQAAPVVTHRPVLVYKDGRPSMHASNIQQHLIEVK